MSFKTLFLSLSVLIATPILSSKDLLKFLVPKLETDLTQSTVPLTDGFFIKLRLRISCTILTIFETVSSSAPGSLDFTISISRSSEGYGIYKNKHLSLVSSSKDL